MAAFSGGGKIELREIPIPEPGPGEALVRVAAVGVCETDVHTSLHSDSHAENPRIMGHEWSGILERAPERFPMERGSRVVGEGMISCGRCPMCRENRINLCASYKEIGFSLPGAYAEYLVLPARNLHELPPSLSFEQGALVEPAAVALHAIDMAGLRSRDRVTVLGPGPIGLLAVQIASVMEPESVLLTGTREDRLTLGRDLGADRTFNVRNVDPVKAVRDATCGGPEVVLDAAGTQSSFNQAVRMVGKGGSVVFIGAWQEVTWNPGILIGKEITIRGSLASPGTWKRSIDLIESGKVKVLPLITHRFPLSQIVKAFNLVDSRGDGVMKAMILV